MSEFSKVLDNFTDALQEALKNWNSLSNLDRMQWGENLMYFLGRTEVTEKLAKLGPEILAIMDIDLVEMQAEQTREKLATQILEVPPKTTTKFEFPRCEIMGCESVAVASGKSQLHLCWDYPGPVSSFIDKGFVQCVRKLCAVHKIEATSNPRLLWCNCGGREPAN